MEKRLIFICLIIFSLNILSACDYIEDYYSQEIFNEKKNSINQYFNSTIETYNHTILGITNICLEGDCSGYEDNTNYPVSEIKQCYFCDIEILGEEMLYLYSTKYSSGSSDISFGCLNKFSGNEIDGLRIIEKTNDLIVARGLSIHEFSQKSLLCDIDKDPNCDNQIYGRCPGPDYIMEFKKEIEFIIKRNN